MEKENKKLLKLRDSIIMLKVLPFTSLFFVCYQFYIYFVYKIIVKAENYELFSPLIKDVSLNDNIKETLLGNPFFYLITLYLAFLFLFINPVITFLADTKMYRFLKNDNKRTGFIG